MRSITLLLMSALALPASATVVSDSQSNWFWKEAPVKQIAVPNQDQTSSTPTQHHYHNDGSSALMWYMLGSMSNPPEVRYREVNNYRYGDSSTYHSPKYYNRVTESYKQSYVPKASSSVVQNTKTYSQPSSSYQQSTTTKTTQTLAERKKAEAKMREIQRKKEIAAIAARKEAEAKRKALYSKPSKSYSSRPSWSSSSSRRR